MTKYIAFLRGINVGARIIKMAELEPRVEKLGFSNVTTVLQTGNIIVESDLKNSTEVREKLTAGISKQFGYDARALVYTDKELADIVDAYPFDQADTAKHDYVIFMEGDATANLMKVAPEIDTANEQIALGHGVVYWNVTKGMTLHSVFAKQTPKVAKQAVTTTRNINTLNKILAKTAAI